MTADFVKTVRIGAYRPEWREKAPFSVYCKIKFANGQLSITGVEGPKENGGCVGGCGQINTHMGDYETARWTFSPGWTADTLARFLAVWGEWHLNGMRAGSPDQTAFLKANPIGGSSSYYEAALAALSTAGLNPDPNHIVNGKPYAYGSAWLRKEVPTDVLDFLCALPDTDTRPAWV